MPRVRPGVVSVILLNYRGASDTVAALAYLAELDWPAARLEVVVVDNASGGDDLERLRAAAGSARVIAAPANLGFAGGCNFGVAAATGEFLAFLNNDARPDPQWLSAAIAVFERDPEVAAVACKVLDWAGETIDYVDSSLTWYGMGYKRETGQPDSPGQDEAHDVLFATGSAMLVRAEVFRAVGGFDERFFMFYEDVDLGWRLNLLGYRVRYVPGSLAYHRHHVSMSRYGEWREHFLHERNALMALYKNYSDETLARVLPAALALAVRRGIARGGDDPGVLDLQRAGPAAGGPVEDEDSLRVAKATLAPVYAISSLVDALPGLAADRAALQAQRVRSDAELLPLFRQALEPAYAQESYLQAHAVLVEAFGIAGAFSSRRRIVIVTGEPLTERMAGPAIRAWEMARVLSTEHDVQLVTLATCTLSHPRFRCSSAGDHQLRRLESWCDVFVFQGLVMAAHHWLRSSTKVIVADVYDPFHLEQLEQAKDSGEAVRRQVVADCTHALNDQLGRGDFFLCASGKQRDFWLGQLTAVGRVNPATYDADETLEALVAVVPFGVPDDPPVRTRPAAKGVRPGIGADDKLVLWGGGVYNWFDPLTLLHAVDRLRHRRPDVRLLFLGMAHPNPAVPRMRMAAAARELADTLGLTEKWVFFNEDWVSYSDRANYLLEADIGVSTHLDHVETAYSFRTRILDYLWAGIPVVATDGDTFGELITARGLGIAVPPGDVAALEEALFRLLDDTDFAAECRRHVAEVAPTLSWSHALEPLVRFCRFPRRAADAPEAAPAASVPARVASAIVVPADRPPGWRGDLVLLRSYLRQGGAGEVVRRANGRIQRRIGERRRPGSGALRAL